MKNKKLLEENVVGIVQNFLEILFCVTFSAFKVFQRYDQELKLF